MYMLGHINYSKINIFYTNNYLFNNNTFNYILFVFISSFVAESSATGWEDKQPKCDELGLRGDYICNCLIIYDVIVFVAVYTTSN